MANDLEMSPQLEHIHGEIRDNFRTLANGFQKLDKIKDSNRQSKQLEELTGRMMECKRLIKEMDREIKDEEARNAPEVNKQLNDEKQSMIKELNSYVALRKKYTNSLGNKRVELFDVGAGASEPTAEENVQVASTMSNQELINAGNKTMDETDQAIECSKMVVEQIIEVGTQTASTLKGQTDQMGRIVNELDTIQFSIKKASQLVKEIGRQKSNSRMPENQQVIGLSWEPKLPTLFSTTKTDNNSVNKFQNHEETSSLWRPNMDLVDGLFVPPNDPKKQNKLLKKQVKDTAGKSWFDMPAPTITSELKKDLQLLKLRSVIDPKRHYKKGDAKSKTLPKYFQVGTVIESSTEFFSSRLTKKERKPNLADELLCDPNLGHYRKRKVREIEKQNHPAGNEKWKIRGRQSQKRAKQRRH